MCFEANGESGLLTSYIDCCFVRTRIWIDGEGIEGKGVRVIRVDGGFFNVQGGSWGMTKNLSFQDLAACTF